MRQSAGGAGGGGAMGVISSSYWALLANLIRKSVDATGTNSDATDNHPDATSANLDATIENPDATGKNLDAPPPADVFSVPVFALHGEEPLYKRAGESSQVFLRGVGRGPPQGAGAGGREGGRKLLGERGGGGGCCWRRSIARV